MNSIQIQQHLKYLQIKKKENSNLIILSQNFHTCDVNYESNVKENILPVETMVENIDNLTNEQVYSNELHNGKNMKKKNLQHQQTIHRNIIKK